MAYSDYGGYAFKNGVRVEERSDFTISPDGTGFGTPGCWPGFAMIAQGLSNDEVKKRIDWPHHHVVLGDGPIFVGLHKQSSLLFYRLGDRLEDIPLLKTTGDSVVKKWTDDKGQLHQWIDTDHFKSSGLPCEFEVDGNKVTVYWIDEENHYQFVRMEQPDGNVWHGWSGYGVGAGLEDCGYGYSTDDQNERLIDFWPAAIKP